MSEDARMDKLVADVVAIRNDVEWMREQVEAMLDAMKSNPLLAGMMR